MSQVPPSPVPHRSLSSYFAWVSPELQRYSAWLAHTSWSRIFLIAVLALIGAELIGTLIRPLRSLQLEEVVLLLTVASAVLKISSRARVRAEARADQAHADAEAEQLRRQLAEAKLATLQAQVEPHFLFNTLASIDHLIETDPPRASLMQKNLIALLRASMPSWRDGRPAVTTLSRELNLVRPYLEILKVRMEERLQFALAVPAGLHSACFPPLMLQALVENAVKHGLEPKAEGGRLDVGAEVVDGQLILTVADTGLGFGKAATGGTGLGLKNLRERLQLEHGSLASLTVASNQPCGTRVTIALPYRTEASAAAAAAATGIPPLPKDPAGATPGADR